MKALHAWLALCPGARTGTLTITGTGLAAPVVVTQTNSTTGTNGRTPGMATYSFTATGPTATFNIARTSIGGLNEAFLNGLSLDLVSVPAPEIQVTGIGNPSNPPTNIIDGDGSPFFGNGTDFGTTDVGTPISRTFTINNLGDAALTVGTPTLPLGFSLGSFPSPIVTAGSSTSFTVTLDALAAGTYSGEVSFVNNDGDENPFNFTITGNVAQVPEPASLALVGLGSLLLLPRGKRA